MPTPCILILDPDPEALEPLRSELRGRARVEVAGTVQEGLERLRSGRWDAAVISLDFEAVDLTLARRIKEAEGVGLVAVSTSEPTLALTLEATRLGIAAVLSSPLRAEELSESLQEAFAPPGEVIPIEPVAAQAADEAIGASAPMLEVTRTVGKVAPSSATVLILGESGTGKELIARAIHRASPRASGPFVAINCAAIPENLLESELFGHEKGAFTGAITRKVGRFERAHGGTLLLDEVGDMSLALQAKILRALQEREIERVGGDDRIPVDVRVIAATNKDLRAAIGRGSFRDDLYYRLAVVTVHLPRLVDRGTDLDLLTRHFVARYAAYYGRPITGIARSALDRLRQHPWPGNIRELKNVIERAVLMSQGSVLRIEHLPLDQLREPAPDPDASAALPGYAPELSAAEVERLHIREVLRLVDGHMGRASEVLGIHRNTLTRKVRDYGLA